LSMRLNHTLLASLLFSSWSMRPSAHPQQSVPLASPSEQHSSGELHCEQRQPKERQPKERQASSQLYTVRRAHIDFHPAWAETLISLAPLLPLALASSLPRSSRVAQNSQHAYSRGHDRASDLTGFATGALVVGVVGGASEAAQNDSLRAGGAVLLIVTQSALMSFSVGRLLKQLHPRCRPLAVGDDGSCQPQALANGSSYAGDEALRSFPSGHVASVAGATGALLGVMVKTATRRGTKTRLRWIGLAVGASLTAATVWLRQRSGAHSYSDTLAAAAVSLPLGFAVAVVHPMRYGSP